MKLLSVVLVLVLAVLSFGNLVEPSADECTRLNLLSSYVDVGRYSGSHPYVDYEEVVKPIRDVLNGRGVSSLGHDLIMVWNEVCKAKTPQAEIEAWKNLARQVDHRMHTSERVLRIARILYGDSAGVWMVKPPLPLAMLGRKNVRPTATTFHLCDLGYELEKIFEKHCGTLGTYGLKYRDTFLAMAGVGLSKDEFTQVAKQACAVSVPSKDS